MYFEYIEIIDNFIIFVAVSCSSLGMRFTTKIYGYPSEFRHPTAEQKEYLSHWNSAIK
jgi:hypothetical protein